MRRRFLPHRHALVFLSLNSYYNKICFLTISTIIFFAHDGAYALNIDSAVNEHVRITKPYIVINIASSDCMLCRAGATGILNNLNQTKYTSDILLLSDDKNMAIYYGQNNDIYGKYFKIFDQSLSRALTLDTFYSSVYFVTDEGIKTYKLNNISSSDVDEMRKELDKKKLGVALMKESHKDASDSTHFLPDERFFYQNKNNCVFLFNSQYQIGVNISPTSVRQQPSRKIL